MADDLRSVLTPSLFTFMAETQMRLSRHEPLDFAIVGKQIFLEYDGYPERITPRAWPALRAIGNLGLENVPDMMTFLPAPSDSSFPEQALGLVLLLDQGPRALCSGVDVRYIRSYFGPIAERLVTSFAALPEHQRPDTFARWEAAGVSFDWWLVSRFWFSAPLVHSESVELQERAVAYTNVTREAVETRTGRRDANRDDPTVWTDTHAFPKTFSVGPPQGHDVTLDSFAFWFCRLMDEHKSIIDKFGRYPYANWQNGRESSPEEEEWIKEEPKLGRVDEEVKRLIMADVEAERWTPLGERPR